MPLDKHTCTICGKEYTPVNSRQTKTCGSAKCQEEIRRTRARDWAREKAREKAKGNRPAGSVQICTECGKEFLSTGTISITCSSACKRKRLSRMAHENHKKRYYRTPEQRILSAWDCEFFNGLNFTPGCTGPADPRYSPMEQHVGPIQWWGQAGVTA